jgi:hypothetical protein
LDDPSLPAALLRYLIRHCDAFIAYTDSRAADVRRICPSASTFVANNTLDVHAISRIRRTLEARGVEAVKAELGLSCRYYFCFIGRVHDE